MRVGTLNMRCGPDIAANLAQAERLIRAAHKDGAQFIVSPENTLIMQSATQALFANIKTEDKTQAVQVFSNLAAELGIDLLIGSMAIKVSAAKAANRSFLFGPDGKIKARYDKIHMFDVTINAQETWRESAHFRAGSTPVMADIEGFLLGMSICYDLRFANLYKYYARRGAHIISVPAAFTAITGAAHWQILLRARAIETSAYIVAAAQGGAHTGGRSTWGRAMIIDPWGEIIAKLDHDEPGFCCADISMETLKDVRARIPAWQQETTLL